jgi:transposase
VIVDKEVFIMSRLSKEERLEVGKALRDKSLSFDDAHAKYGVGQTCLYMWLREYERSIGAAAPAKPAKQEIPSDYSAMSKDELIKELMRKDIEAARLKKGYAAEGSGTEKEFVSISGKNTK